MQTTLILVSILTIGFVVGVNSGKACGNKPADVVFVLDDSGSIHGPDFNKQMIFVKKLIQEFDVRFNHTHVGVLVFSSEIRIIFNLGKYTEQEEFKRAIEEIKQTRGQTYTDKALKRMREEMFSAQYTRSWVPHVAIVITDGESDHHDRTKEEARLVHETDIEVYAIGVGHAINREELVAIASESDMVHTVDSYEALDTLLGILASKDCPVPSTFPPTTTTTTEPPPQMIEGCNGHKELDLTWSISSHACAEETRLAIDFIKGMVEDMTFDPHHVQVGLAPRFCDEPEAQEGIQLKDHDTGSGFLEALDKRQLTGLRQTHQAIDYVRGDWYTNKNAGRPGAVKYGILIIDNRLENWEKALEEAQRAKKDGIRLIVIGVGDRVQQDQLRQLSWSERNYFYARSYSELADFKSQLIQTICEGITDRALPAQVQQVQQVQQYNIKGLREYLEQF